MTWLGLEDLLLGTSSGKCFGLQPSDKEPGTGLNIFNLCSGPDCFCLTHPCGQVT